MKKYLALTICTLFLFTGFTYAKVSSNKTKRTTSISKILKLTSIQKKRLKKVSKQSKNRISALKRKKTQKSTLLKRALANNSSETKIRKLHSQVNTIQKEIKKLKFQKTLSIRKVLTAKQRKVFFKMKPIRR